MHTIQLPPLESPNQTATVLQWLKAPGATVAQGDLLALLETETASVELVSNQVGVLAEILVGAGATAGLPTHWRDSRPPGENQTCLHPQNQPIPPLNLSLQKRKRFNLSVHKVRLFQS
jgi:hypothetical protein